MAPDPLLEIAARVSDGRSVDWTTLQSSVDSTRLGTVEQLRVLAEIARVHGSAPDDDSGLDLDLEIDPSIEPALFEWGGLRALEKLGEGSFGEVYRAWDTSLDREVALKLLKQRHAEARASDVIVREGHMLARVRHPNVMAVYGAQSLDGRVGIWGEFLHGRTLADIVEQDGALGAQEAGIWIDAVCRALSAVHRAGLLHRDVKAQNVMREAGGRIVLMDLGLGREAAAAGNRLGLELTGTPAYLAPELFAGAAASARSDVYSVGVLLFYILTGAFPVEARSYEELKDAHANRRRRRLQDLRSDLPAALTDAVDRALSPDPATRFESAGELQAAVASALHGRHSGAAVGSRRATLVATIAGVLVGIGAAALMAFALMKPTAPAAPYFLSFSPPPGLRFTQGARNVPALSPDGQRVAFVATDSNGTTQLWLRRMAESAATAIPGSQSATGPFWSPDGQSLAFFTSTGLHRVSLSGARSEKLAEVWESRGASWGPDDRLVIAARHLDGLWELPAAGGVMTQLTRLDPARAELAHMWPQFLGDGRVLFFIDSDREAVRGIYLTSPGGPPVRLIAADASATYADGHIFFVRDSKLFAQPLDLDAGATTGAAVALAEQVGVTYNLRSAISVSDSGLVVYASRSRDFRRIVWYDFNGRELGVVAAPEKYRNPTMSRDGRYLAIEWYDALSEIRVFDLVRGGWTSLRAGYQAQLPIFGPGHHLTFSLYRGDLYRFDLDGASAPSRVYASPQDKEATDWSPDGSVIAFAAIGERGFRKLWTIAPGETEARRLIDRRNPGSAADFQEVQGRFSPDGRTLAYLSTRSGRTEVYIRTPWQTGAERKISLEGGYNPMWRGNDELLYLDPSGALFLAYIDHASGGPTAVPARRLFQSGVDTPGTSRNHFVVTPDGTRVLFAEPVQDPSATSFGVIGNWRRGAASQ